MIGYVVFRIGRSPAKIGEDDAKSRSGPGYMLCHASAGRTLLLTAFLEAKRMFTNAGYCSAIGKLCESS